MAFLLWERWSTSLAQSATATILIQCWLIRTLTCTATPPPPETPEPLRGHAPDKGAIVLVGVKCQPALRRTILFASAASATDEMRTCAQSSLGGMGRRLRIGANGGGFGWVSQARPCRSTKAFSGTTPFLSKTPLPLQKTIMAKFSTNCSSTPYGCSNSGSVHRGATGVVGI